MRSALAWALLTLSVGCSGETATGGITEPIRIEGAQFREGPLPGDSAALDGAQGPRVTGVSLLNRIISTGEVGKVMTGHASVDAEAVAVRFRDLGRGYWVVPVGAPDPQNSGELAWSMTAAFDSDVAPGLHDLLFAAIGGSGNSGAQLPLQACVARPFPDNSNSCDPKLKPPRVVLSLVWDTPVDLDLRVVAPNGKVVGGKAFSTVIPSDGGISESSLKADDTGILDRDANGGCRISGARREDITWKGAPLAGKYQIFVNLFDACGQGSARFSVLAYTAKDLPDGTHQLIEEPTLASGELVSAQANGGAKPGLFVTEINLQ